MNNDLISREALKKALQNREDCKKCTAIDCISCFYEIIDNAPTINPSLNLEKITEADIEKFKIIWQRATSKGLSPIIEDRPQGEWIDYDNTFYKCPECGYLLEKCCPQCQTKVILPIGGKE